MRKINFIFLICGLLFLGCEAKNNDSSSFQAQKEAVNLAESEGCAGESADKQSDKVSFAQSSKLESSSSTSSSNEELTFEEEKKSDSGCTL